MNTLTESTKQHDPDRACRLELGRLIASREGVLRVYDHVLATRGSSEVKNTVVEDGADRIRDEIAALRLKMGETTCEACLEEAAASEADQKTA